MTNLIESPITVVEKLLALKSAIKILQAQSEPGDIHVAALKAIAMEIGEAELDRIKECGEYEGFDFPSMDEVEARIESWRKKKTFDEEALKRSFEIADKLDDEGVPEAAGALLVERIAGSKDIQNTIALLNSFE